MEHRGSCRSGVASTGNTTNGDKYAKTEWRKKTQKAYYYADSIISLKFWSGGKIIIGAKSKQASCAAKVLGSFFFLLLWLRFFNSERSSHVDYCYVRRRAECTSLCAGLQHRSLRSNSSLATKRRAEALHVVFFFNKASAPSTRAPAALCVLSHDT